LPAPENPYTLKEGKVIKVIKETPDVYTFYIQTEEKPLPGQYNMLYAFGMGEAPITVASAKDGYVVHTVRAVGNVTKHIDRLREGDLLYYRGPYGNRWRIEEAYGGTLLILSGGLGLAATRWIFQEAIEGKHPIKRVVHLYGSKNYESLLYSYLYPDWEKACEFYITLDKPHSAWKGRVGLITDVLKDLKLEENTVVFACGPDPMVKACVKVLEEKGIPQRRVYVSLERHMKCSVGTCGHCMIGPYFVCKDGPIFRHDLIREYFERREV